MPVQAPARPRTVLRDLVDERGLIHQFVAGKIGTTPSSFTRILNRERPISASELFALVELLGVESTVFFNGCELLLSSDTSTNDLPPLLSSSEGGAEEAGDVA